MRRRRIGAAAVMSCLGAFASVQAAEVYKYRAADGSLVFTDRKPEEPAEKVVVAPGNVPTVAERKDAIRQRQGLDGIARDRLQREAEDAAAARAAQARKQQADAARCRKAREDNAYFQADGVYVASVSDGKRTFLSTEEVQRRRDVARQDMSQYCH
jgi:uncharacterized protein DUF4124